MLYLHGAGHFHPDEVIDNKFLTSLDIGVDEEWILRRVGIHQRRTVLDPEYIRTTRNSDVRAAREGTKYSNAQTGAMAAKMAIARAGLEPAGIGLVVAGGCSPDHQIPADACCIAAQLGMEVPAFDINSACSSFAVQIWNMSNLVDHALPDFVLIVNADNNTRFVNYNDRRTSVLWGDGSSAVVVSRRVPSRIAMHATTPQSSPANWDKVRTPNGGHFDQDGQAVQAFAIRTMSFVVEQLQRVEDTHERTYFVGHQANLLALEGARRRLDIPATNHWFNVDWFGNCGAAGAPSVISQHWDDLHAGQSILMAVVGSGLTWGGLRLQVLQEQI